MSAGADPRGRRHPMPVVIRARELHTAGWNPTDISRILARENIIVTHHTVRRWVDAGTAERVATRVRSNHRAQRWRRPWTFRLGGNRASVEYQAAFVRRLRDEDVTWENVARVCRVVFGGRFTVDRVKQLHDHREAVAA